MRDDELDRGPAPLPPVPADELGDMPDDVGAPNCPECLVPMLPADGDREPVWSCPECGLVLL